MYVKRVAVVISIVVCCAGMAAGQTAWVDHPENPVLGPGEPGSWDAFNRVAGAVLFDGSTYHMWFAGRDQSSGTDQIGHATSTDGVEWDMDPANPVLTPGAPGEWDEFLWSPAPTVIDHGGQYHMWYSGRNADGTVQGGYATSPNGTEWAKHAGNPVLPVGPPESWDDNNARPDAVVFDGEEFRMWYSGWDGSILAIGYADSEDGVQWDKNPSPILEGSYYPNAWDELLGNPSVVFDGTVYHMWYVGGRYSDLEPQVGYAFSTDGGHWTKHRGNPVISVEGHDIIKMPVVFDGSTWHGWYYSVSADDENHVSYATSDCCDVDPALDRAQYIPAAALAAGLEGSFYQSDVDLNNAGDQPVEYQFMWLPRGEDCSDPATSEVFSLGADMSVRYTNVLAEVFGLEPNSLGALAILSSSPDLLAMSRTYNIPSTETAGTFGQSVPAVSASDFIQSGERQRILFASENADLRTNIGCQNGGPTVTPVNVELFNSDGTSLETARIVLYPWSNDQLNRVFQDYQPVEGYVDVWTTAGDRLFYCYGSVLDNVTSDPTTILPQ